MDQHTTNFWAETLGEIRAGLKNDHTFHIWFDPIKYVAHTSDSITLEVPNTFFKNWLTERYMDIIERAVLKAGGKQLSIEFTVREESDTRSSPERQEAERRGGHGFWPSSFFQQREKTAEPAYMGLNEKYTFESFVVGPSNRFAHAASLAICESPAKAYNPLFIYGGVGLGKTHMMQAIGHRILQAYPRLKVLYISSEDFTNQLISAIQNRSTLKFRQTYRNLDVLMIDDVQFIAGKESTQEEFFHTFNTLHDAHKQIVISSDRSPKEISSLEQRLVSRFGWGLVTDIQVPDFETRIAILKKKQEKESIFVPDEVMYFLAEKIHTNIRELEGALIRVVAYVKLIGKDVTLEVAKEVLKDMILEEQKKISIESIQKKVAAHFNIATSDMKVKKRTRTLAYPRQVAMYLCRRFTEHSLPEIGESFGGRDHTTVIHACEKIENDIAKNENTKKMVALLIQEIKT